MSADRPAHAPGTPSATGSADGAAPRAEQAVLAEIVRSGFVEGQHRGSLVLLAPDGSVELALGEVTAPIFPRSTTKPMQAVAVLRAGVELAGERLALAAGSHSGEDFHRDLVRQLLAEHELTPDDLACPPDLPLDQVAREAHLAAGGGRERVAMNCSGKHAAMLAACRRAGWPTESYLAPEHPLQVQVRNVVEEVLGEPVTVTGTDGCGAPVMGIGLTDLARVFRHFVLAAPGTLERRVADAMRAHPEYVAGTRRADTWVMQAVPGALVKSGAEAVQAVGLADGRALAFKIDDGAARALGPVLARALSRAGVQDDVLSRIGHEPLMGGEQEVGSIRAVF